MTFIGTAVYMLVPFVAGFGNSAYRVVLEAASSITRSTWLLLCTLSDPTEQFEASCAQHAALVHQMETAGHEAELDPMISKPRSQPTGSKQIYLVNKDSM